jgi:ABC-type transporter Mla maintaining outer membrane lipid asymmetry permease subunit MlaE
MLQIFQNIGTTVLDGLRAVGRMFTFLGTTFSWIFIPPLKFRRFIRQVGFIGARITQSGRQVHWMILSLMISRLRKVGSRPTSAPWSRCR